MIRCPGSEIGNGCAAGQDRRGARQHLHQSGNRRAQGGDRSRRQVARCGAERAAQVADHEGGAHTEKASRPRGGDREEDAEEGVTHGHRGRGLATHYMSSGSAPAVSPLPFASPTYIVTGKSRLRSRRPGFRVSWGVAELAKRRTVNPKIGGSNPPAPVGLTKSPHHRAHRFVTVSHEFPLTFRSRS